MRTPDTEFDAEDYKPGPLTKQGIEAIGQYIYEANADSVFRNYDPGSLPREYETRLGYDAGPEIAELLFLIEPEMVKSLISYYYALQNRE